MVERNALRMQAQRGVTHGERLRFSYNSVGEIGSVSDDRESQMPEMDADLIGATCARVGFEERSAVGVTREHAEGGVGRESGFIHAASAEFACLRAQRRVADELIVWRVTLHAGEVHLLDFATLKLWLHGARTLA